MSSRRSAFLMMATANLAVLQGLTLWADARWAVTYRETFIYLLVVGALAKVLGDLIYYILSPGRRHWLYLEDYVVNDLLVHSRFVVPLAIAQGWIAAQAPLYAPFAWAYLRHIVISPLLGVVLWAVNRHLVEQAEEKRHHPLGTHAAALTANAGKAGTQEGQGNQRP